MLQIATLLASRLVPGNCDKPKDLPYRCALSRKLIELFSWKKMKPIGLHKIVNYDFDYPFIWYSTNKKESSKDYWDRVSEESQERCGRKITYV